MGIIWGLSFNLWKTYMPEVFQITCELVVGDHPPNTSWEWLLSGVQTHTDPPKLWLEGWRLEDYGWFWWQMFRMGPQPSPVRSLWARLGTARSCISSAPLFDLGHDEVEIIDPIYHWHLIHVGVEILTVAARDSPWNCPASGASPLSATCYPRHTCGRGAGSRTDKISICVANLPTLGPFGGLFMENVGKYTSPMDATPMGHVGL